MNISFCQTGNLHSGKDIAVKLMQLAMVVNDWIIKGRSLHSYWNLRRHLIHPHMNSVKANRLATVLVERH